MFDILIKKGMVFNGTGTPPVKADIGIKGDLIIAVGDLDDSNAVDVINASGRASVLRRALSMRTLMMMRRLLFGLIWRLS